MTALKILGAVALILFLLGLIRVGGEAEYSADGFRARVKVGPVKLQVFPLPRKEKKEKKEPAPPKKKQEPKEETDKAPKNKVGIPGLIKDLLPLVGKAVGGLKRRIRIDRLDAVWIGAGADDAAGAAMMYGYLNAAAGTLLSFLRQNFDLKEYHIHTNVDFSLKSPVISLQAGLSGRLGVLVIFFTRLGLKALFIYLRHKTIQTPPKPGQHSERGDYNGRKEASHQRPDERDPG